MRKVNNSLLPQGNEQPASELNKTTRNGVPAAVILVFSSPSASAKIVYQHELLEWLPSDSD